MMSSRIRSGLNDCDLVERVLAVDGDRDFAIDARSDRLRAARRWARCRRRSGCDSALAFVGHRTGSEISSGELTIAVQIHSASRQLSAICAPIRVSSNISASSFRSGRGRHGKLSGRGCEISPRIRACDAFVVGRLAVLRASSRRSCAFRRRPCRAWSGPACRCECREGSIGLRSS